MGKVNVIIIDATGNKEQRVGLPDDIKCGIIMVKLIEKIKLPSVGPDGNPISYKFIHKVSGRQLLEAQTLSEAGVRDGDVLRLQPEITAGAFCPKCGSNVLPGCPFCPTCGTAIEEAPQQNTFNQASNTPFQNGPYQNGGFPPQANQGQMQPNQAYTVSNPQPDEKKKNAKKTKIVNIISAIVGIVCGIVMIGESFNMRYFYGTWVSKETYGGDAYTGIQNAAADTANNIKGLISEISHIAEQFFFVAGLLIIAFCTMKLIKAIVIKND